MKNEKRKSERVVIWPNGAKVVLRIARESDESLSRKYTALKTAIDRMHENWNCRCVITPLGGENAP